MIKIGSPLTAYFLCFCDRFWGFASGLSQDCFCVATSENKISENVWNETESVVTLHRKHSTNSINNLKLKKGNKLWQRLQFQ